VEFRVLGPLEVTAGDRPIALGGGKQRVVLTHLLLRANKLIPADRLIDEVWGDDPPAAARNVLQTYVSRLRKAIGAERLEHGAGGYVLYADASEIDANRFQALVEEARRRAPGDAGAAAQLYREADALWRGPALDDLADQPSLRAEIGHLEELRAAATEARVIAELALGRHAELVPELGTLTALYPHREGVWAHLITALYRSGRQADALAAYRRARTVLVEELGIEPSPDLRRLEQQVLQQDAALEVTGQPLRGYRLLQRVGEGAFGVVHRALQPQVGREVAVKVIRPAFANDPEFIRRFEAEAQLVARLEHPRIVPLYDYWREPDGAFLVMRFLRGGSLRAVLTRGPVTLEAALLVAEHVGAALASAHGQGVVHRDVKPANILLDDDGNAYLSDFGIARDVTVARTPERGETPNTSAYYASPEEIRGEEPTFRADVYSLGLVLFEMLTGRHPFADASAEDLLGGRVRPTVPPLRGIDDDIPPEVDEIVRRASLEDPAGRYPDAAALLDALQTAVDAVPRAVAVPAEPVRNPYKGLRPFLEADARDFQGRASLTRHLIGRLADGGSAARLLALVGPSGSGKSSAVRAGLVPALRAGAVAGSERWFVAEMLPGEDPFAELAAALVGLAAAAPPADLATRLARDERALLEAAAWVLPDERSELLLVVDQFEELFTLVSDEDRRARFLRALRAAATERRSRVRIVLTLRADFLDRPLAHAGFAAALREGMELILPLTGRELEQAITVPARSVGVTVEQGLVAELATDVSGQPGALPLLQFTLAELFDRRHDGTLTPASYRALGGVAGAVARGAEDAYVALDHAGRGAARQLFLRLVDAGDAIQSIRRRVPRGELVPLSGDEAGMEAAIEAFARRRLLSFDRDPDTREPTVEIGHDALLAAWDRLREWVAEAREDLRTQRQVAAAAREWRDAGHDPSFLVRGARLDRFEAWRDGAELALTPEEAEFVEASVAERDRLQAEDAARQARERELERRSLRRLRGLVAVLAVAAVAAGALTVFAFEQRDDAERERRTAVARGLASAALASLETDAERSILLALEAIAHTRSADGSVLPEAREALHRAVTASRIELRVPGLGGALDWSPDGSLFVTEGREESGVIDIRDARTGRSVRSFRGHAADVNLVAFSADGSMLATSADDGTVKVWDPRTGELRRTIDGQGDQVWGLSFSPDGKLLAAAAWADEAVRVWDVETGRRVREIRPVVAAFTTAFSPDGRRLAIAGFDASAVVVDVSSGDVLYELRSPQGVSDVDWSPDGRWIAGSSPDSTVRIWEADTGRPRFTLFGHKGEVVAADWAADSRRLATGSTDGTAKVWAVSRDGTRELQTMTVQERGGGVWVAFSPDGARLMTGDQQIAAVKVWDVSRSGNAEWANVPADAREPSGVAFTANGAGVVAGNGDGSVTVWESETGKRSFTLPGPEREPAAPMYGVDAGRDGAVAATAGDIARVWDLKSRARLVDLAAPGAEDVDWHPEGGLLAIASFEGPVRIVDRSGKERASIAQPSGFLPTAVRFSPDGRLLAVAHSARDRPGSAAPLTIHDWRRGSEVRDFRAAAVAVAFSRDGRLFAAAPFFGPVRIWDVRTGRDIARLVGHTGAVNDVEFAPDRSVVATASNDGTVRLWNPLTGRQELVLRGHDGIVWDVEFSPDGSKLASAGPEGIVRVWALDLDDLIAIARRNVTRKLTTAECRQYLRDRGCG
jgi:WD40 repeat protein/DNA-binding SARP family transcriptional activator